MIRTADNRRSAKAVTPLSVVSHKPLAPPRGMSPEGRKLWRQIVGSFPPDYLRPSDAEPLRQYVEAMLSHNAACETLRREGFVLTANGVPRLHPAAVLMRQCAATVAQLGGKLRLHASARTRTDVAATAANRPPSSVRKPWEY